jgi:hypothetical protein
VYDVDVTTLTSFAAPSSSTPPTVVAAKLLAAVPSMRTEVINIIFLKSNFMIFSFWELSLIKIA